jgi:hypothetical protein
VHLSFLKNAINIALSWDVKGMATGIMRGCWRLSDEIAFMVGGKERQCRIYLSLGASENP